MLKIGSKYEETKKDLIERIREGMIVAVQMDAGENSCYFCNKPIKGKMWVLVDAPLDDPTGRGLNIILMILATTALEAVQASSQVLWEILRQTQTRS